MCGFKLKLHRQVCMPTQNLLRLLICVIWCICGTPQRALDLKNTDRIDPS